MKRVIIVMICASLILEGCYSYSAIAPDAAGKYNTSPGKRLKMGLKDGSEIEAEQEDCVSVEVPSTFVYGRGKQSGAIGDDLRDFKGIM